MDGVHATASRRDGSSSRLVVSPLRSSKSETVVRIRAGLRDGPVVQNVGGAVALQLALLVSGVLGARILGPESRGYLAILAIWSSTVCQLGTAGIALGVSYYLAAGRISGSEIVGLLRSSAAVQVAIVTAVYAAIIFGYVFVSGPPILVAACLSLTWIPATFALDYGIALALGGRRHGLASGVRAVAPALGAFGLVWIYLDGTHSLNAVTTVISASVILGGAIALGAGLRVARTLRVTTSLLGAVGPSAAKREIISFGRRGYVGYLSPTDAFRVDQLVVGFLLSPHVLGVYVVGAAFTTFTRAVAANVGLSGASEVAKHHDPAEARRALKRTLLVAAGVLTAITCVLGLAASVAIPVLFGEQFKGAVPIAELLLIASLLLSMKRIAVDLLRGAGEAQAGTRAEMISLGTFLSLCVPAALALGGTGVAASLVVASAAGSIHLAFGLFCVGEVSDP